MTSENLVQGTLKQYGKIAGIKVKTEDGHKFYIPLEPTDFVELKNDKNEVVLSGVFSEKKEEFIQVGLGLSADVMRDRPTIIKDYMIEKHQPTVRKKEILGLN